MGSKSTSQLEGYWMGLVDVYTSSPAADTLPRRNSPSTLCMEKVKGRWQLILSLWRRSSMPPPKACLCWLCSSTRSHPYPEKPKQNSSAPGSGAAFQQITETFWPLGLSFLLGKLEMKRPPCRLIAGIRDKVYKGPGQWQAFDKESCYH